VTADYRVPNDTGQRQARLALEHDLFQLV